MGFHQPPPPTWDLRTSRTPLWHAHPEGAAAETGLHGGSRETFGFWFPVSRGGGVRRGRGLAGGPANGPEDLASCSHGSPQPLHPMEGWGVSGKWGLKAVVLAACPREEGCPCGGSGGAHVRTQSHMAWLPGGNRNGPGTRGAVCGVNICSQLQPDGSRQGAWSGGAGQGGTWMGVWAEKAAFRLFREDPSLTAPVHVVLCTPGLWVETLRT